TTWLTFRIRSKNSGDFMEGSRAMPAFIVGILLMNHFTAEVYLYYCRHCYCLYSVYHLADIPYS
ncbi:hypothetical protein C7D74_33195, partial [Klebsiella pneumoniae]